MLPIKALIEVVAMQTRSFNSTFVTDENFRKHLDTLADANADYARAIVGATEKMVKEVSNQLEAQWEAATDAVSKED